jgi:hypothetical protein
MSETLDKPQADAAQQGQFSHSRLDRTCAGDPELRALVERLLDVSKRGLVQMFDKEKARFVHCVRRHSDGRVLPEGENLRYSAIVVLGARWLPEAEQREIFGGESAGDFCTRLVEEARFSEDLGAASLCAWAAFEVGHPTAHLALARACELESAAANSYTVDLAWLGSALAASTEFDAEASARGIAHRLLGGFEPKSCLFQHRAGGIVRGPRAHVACFADQAYPIQALSRLHRRFGADRAIEAATACAARLCEVQGEGGQWWWHYDVRSGAVVEGYPVYSVHQEAMAPMSLLDLEEAGGPAHTDAIQAGLRWMAKPAELDITLIDDEEVVIWRKVARVGPSKLMSAANAAASKLHEGLRMGFLGAVFPPRRVDWESRPYHLGWVLHAWLNES